MQISREVGQNIKLIRELKGYSQQGLADSIGVSQKKISRMENGVSSPSIELLDKIADCFETDLNMLLKSDKNALLISLTNRMEDKSTKNDDPLTSLYQSLLEEKERYINLLEKELEWLRKK